MLGVDGAADAVLANKATPMAALSCLIFIGLSYPLFM
jgi:hypothetical protein